MSGSNPRRRLAEALSVTWTSALQAETKARIDGAIASARRRRMRVTKMSVLLATICAGSLVFAFSRGISRRGEDGEVGDDDRPRRPTQPRVAAPPQPTPPEPPPSVSPAASEAPVPPPTVPTDRSVSRWSKPAAAPVPPDSSAARDPIEELFARADRARLAGFPNEALQPLTEIQERFPTDRRAAVAAFQLGRIFADELGDPERAARAFERAEALAPAGPLARDARARAGEARRSAAATKPAPEPTP